MEFGPCCSLEMNASTSLSLMMRKLQNGKKRAFIEVHDEIHEKNRVIEQLNKTISEMKSNLEKKETVNDENEDEIVRKFEEFYV